MNSSFFNTYSDGRRAASYASLEFPGTYYLAFRDLPAILETHATGQVALDFGCGAGRSTRFIRDLGFTVTGVDISTEMITLAQANDPSGDYRLIEADSLAGFTSQSIDLVLSIFPFDNIPTAESKVKNLAEFGRVLRPGGCIVNLVSSPDIYVNEWVSFSSRDFPENRQASSGDMVRVVMLDVEDSRPVDDIFWTHESYLEVYREAGLRLIETYRPLGKAEDEIPWETELSVAPWVIYVLEPGN